MFDQALGFLFDTVFGLITYALLLRFSMQWLRAPFRNPIGQAVVALTDWVVRPVRRIVRGVGGFDASTLLLAWAAQLLWLLALRAVVGAGFGGAVVPVLALYAVVELAKAMLWLLIIVVIAQAVLSWTAPHGPMSGMLNALTFRFLAPIRRAVPPVGGTLDLSPLILIVVVQLLLMLPVRWLEVTVLLLAR